VEEYASSIEESFDIIQRSINLNGLLPPGAFEALVRANRIGEGLSKSQIQQGALGSVLRDSSLVNPSNNIFREPDENFEFFNVIELGLLNLNQDQQDAIDDEVQSVRTFTVEDLRSMKNSIQDLTNGIANQFGAGDEVYSNIYGTQEPRERVVQMTVDENEFLVALWEVVQGMDYLTANKSLDNDRVQNPMQFVGGLAEEAGIEFNISSSKILVPVPYKLTIEQIAMRYLGNPDRWIEIATLNNLKSPYIDETGFVREFLSNGTGRQFTINSDEDIYVGQRITLGSNTVPQFTRRISDIERISEGTYLITVSGLADLDTLITTDAARMVAYLPGTVNSQNMIFIPSDQPEPEQDETFTNPIVDEDAFTGISRVNWLLTDDGDIATDARGEIMLANGITNLVQTLRLMLVTQKNSLIRHPDFGLGLSPGASVADITAEDIFNDLNEMIVRDPRFNNLERLTFNINPPAVSIDMSVSLASTGRVFPINFKLNV
jgi:hypothetical protein